MHVGLKFRGLSLKSYLSLEQLVNGPPCIYKTSAFTVIGHLSGLIALEPHGLATLFIYTFVETFCKLYLNIQQNACCMGVLTATGNLKDDQMGGLGPENE
jgi:hypothetical protein